MEVPDTPACRAASPSARLSGAEAPPSRVNTPCASGLTLVPAALRAGSDLPSGWPWTSSPQGALRVKVQIPCQPPTGLCFELSNFRGAEYNHQPPTHSVVQPLHSGFTLEQAGGQTQPASDAEATAPPLDALGTAGTHRPGRPHLHTLHIRTTPSRLRLRHHLRVQALPPGSDTTCPLLSLGSY